MSLEKFKKPSSIHRCPKCNSELNVQPSVATNYFKVDCFNLILVYPKRGEPKSKVCGYTGFIKYDG